MQTLEIQNNKTQQVNKQAPTLNINTIEAINELKAGKGKKFDSVDELFKSI